MMKVFFTLVFCALATLQVYAQIIPNNIDLFSTYHRDILNKKPDVIHRDNLRHLNNFKAFDVESLSLDRGNDYHRPKFLHPINIRQALVETYYNPVVALYNNSVYDPKNKGIGFCFGRAMFVHLYLMQRGLDRRSIQKAFVIGSMETPDGKKWGWHVTTIARTKDDNNQEVWVAIDPILNEIMIVDEWYQKMRNNFSKDKKLKLYITFPTRFGPAGSYHEKAIRDKFYNNYFTDMMNWFDEESRKGTFKDGLLKY
jgi:hypothetical protein